MNISKRVNVIRVTMSTAKARKIMNTVLGPCADYAADPLLQDVYLRGVLDVLGKGLGFEFRRAVLSGDMRRVARFCSDGWRVLGCDRAAFGLGAFEATLALLVADAGMAVREASVFPRIRVRN